MLVYVDDLRVNDDGTESMPHQDALHDNGVSFTQARAMYPMCGPIRNALLSGMRPDSSQTWYTPTTHAIGSTLSVYLAIWYGINQYLTAAIMQTRARMSTNIPSRTSPPQA